jgi:hypothetical protein
MRGLDIRVNMALERVRAVIHTGADPDVSNDRVVDLLWEAKSLGLSDADAGHFQLPPMFVGEAELTHWWEDGQGLAASLDEMRQCSSCHDGTGHPCPTHG